MAIETTYREMLLEDELKSRLQQGESVSSSDLREIVEDLLESTDLSKPQFVASDYHVKRFEDSSAAKFNNTFEAMHQDIRVLYKELIKLSLVSLDAHERWGIEASILEKKLIDLEERIENLLLLTQDTEGYFKYIVENFTDTTLVDLDNSTVAVDPLSQTCGMAPGAGNITRVFLNDLSLESDVSFKVRTTGDIINRTQAVGSTLADVFSQTTRTWWTSVQLSKVKPVTTEIVVKLTNDSSVAISRILIDLHHSGQSSAVTITPLYSLDNYTFTQFATVTPSQEVRSNALFTFPETEVKWVKFLMTKTGPDPALVENTFSYQFGFKKIAFFRESFDSDTAQQLFSETLWVQDSDGNPVTFEKMILEVCEKLETNTNINYFITTSTSSTIPITASTEWTPISPLNRENPRYPTLLTVGDIEATSLGDDSSEDPITISYDSTQVSGFINPAASFNLIQGASGGGTEIVAVTATDTRYRFVNPEDFLLNYQLKSDVEINENSLQVFRNVGEQGLHPTVTDYSVRGIQRGWGFQDPWYTCVIYIENAGGMTIDVGDKFIYIDDIKYSGKIESSVLTGKTLTQTGVHRIRVHKNNWKHVASGATSLSGLKAADSLYPYNQKMLIEGYSYGGAYPDTDEKIYTGADLFAEMQMQKISIFDMLYNIAPDAYKYFAQDLDAVGTHTGDTVPTKVFVVKSNVNSSDFQNEQFVIRFTLINQLRSYFKLRADFSTDSEEVAPVLISYKVKLG